MALASAVDMVSHLHFPEMTPSTVRDVTKELLALANNETVVEKELSMMNSDQLDVLMKVIYVGLAGDFKNSASYLKWHAAAYEKAGPGAIVRTLSDKSPSSSLLDKDEAAATA
jgi:hypothetical protein